MGALVQRGWLAALLGWSLATGIASALSPMPLVGTVWEWERAGAAASGRAAIDERSRRRYTLELAPGGALRVQADCNHGSGRYEHDGDQLRLGPIATTKKGCPAGSLGTEFVRRLAGVDGYRFEGTTLVLTSGNAAELRFRPDAR